jgi:uncharacterized protein (DUF305 family)
MHMKLFFFAIIIAGGTGLIACGGSTGPSEEKPTDSQMVAEHVDPSTKFPQQVVEADTLSSDVYFVDNAIQSVEETLALTDLAIKKAAHPSVKNVAQTISLDNRQLHSALQKLKQQNPSEDTTKRYTDGSREALEKLSGAAFDQQWVDKMITWNTARITRYERESGAVKDKDVKKLVDNVLPKLKAHQQQLESCRVKLQ